MAPPPPEALEILAALEKEAAGELPDSDGIKRSDEAAGNLAKLMAARPIIVEIYGLADAYAATMRALSRDWHTRIKQHGYSDLELYAVTVPGPSQPRPNPIGMITRSDATVAFKRLERDGVVVSQSKEIKDSYGNIVHDEYSEMHSRPRPEKLRGTCLIWDLPPPKPKREIPEYEGDVVTDLAPVIAERNAILAALKSDIATAGPTCESCAHCVVAGSLGFCRAGVPDPRNAASLAERIGQPLAAVPLAAQWPIVSLDAGCGCHVEVEKDDVK